MKNGILTDSRMLFSSGIGRYLRNILSEVSVINEGDLFTQFICNSDDQVEWVQNRFPKAEVNSSDWPIYSLKELYGTFGYAMKSELFWSPHFNYPLFGRGKRIATIHDVIPWFLRIIGEELRSHFTLG